MNKETNSGSRKKFISWAVTAFAALTTLKFFSSSKKQSDNKVKMLTQDGRLIVIDKRLISTGAKIITDDELQHWVKR